MSGFLILTTRPFHLGDQIEVKGFEGTVERIELRATHLRTYDNRLVIIPNSDLYLATITNNTASPNRRQEFVVGVGYDADIERVRAVALDAVKETPGVLREPASEVLVDALTPGSVNLKVRFFAESRRGPTLTVGSAVQQRIKEAFAGSGISVYPSSPQQIELVGKSAAAANGNSADGRADQQPHPSLPPTAPHSVAAGESLRIRIPVCTRRNPRKSASHVPNPRRWVSSRTDRGFNPGERGESQSSGATLPGLVP